MIRARAPPPYRNKLTYRLYGERGLVPRFWKKEETGMYGKIVGMGQVIEGTSKKTGKTYHGQTIHMLCEKRGVKGHAAKEQFVNFLDMEKPPVFKIGDNVFMDFDDKGFMLTLEIIPPEK